MQCGIHFPQDFEETLKPTCNFWGDRTIGNFPIEIKKKIWDWVFSAPSDEIFVSLNMGMHIDFKFSGVIPGTKWEDIFPNWNDLTEDERQIIERKHYKQALYGKPEMPAPQNAPRQN